jgi:hypothetical protein
MDQLRIANADIPLHYLERMLSCLKTVERTQVAIDGWKKYLCDGTPQDSETAHFLPTGTNSFSRIDSAVLTLNLPGINNQ